MCNRPELLDANIRGVVKQSYSNNDKIQYVCTYSQEVHEAKCEEGVWTGIKDCSGMEPIYRFPQLEHENRVGDVGGGLNCENKKAALMTCGWGCNMFPSLSWSACPKAVIPHGFAVGKQGNKLSYTCDEGYKLLNKGWWGEATCVNHLWSGLEKCIGKSASPITISKSAWKMQDWPHELILQRGNAMWADSCDS